MDVALDPAMQNLKERPAHPSSLLRSAYVSAHMQFEARGKANKKRKQESGPRKSIEWLWKLPPPACPRTSSTSRIIICAQYHMLYTHILFYYFVRHCRECLLALSSEAQALCLAVRGRSWCFLVKISGATYVRTGPWTCTCRSRATSCV